MPDATLRDDLIALTLRRHLTNQGHTPESYREAYGLPRDYPMVAASYAESRRALAKAIGLGCKPGTKAPVAKSRTGKLKPAFAS